MGLCAGKQQPAKQPSSKTDGNSGNKASKAEANVKPNEKANETPKTQHKTEPEQPTQTPPATQAGNQERRTPSTSEHTKYILDAEVLSKGLFTDHYDVGPEIGRGAFSIVREAKHKVTGEQVAVKTIDKRFLKKKNAVLVKREITIMKKVSHPHILSLKEVYENDDQLDLVMELLRGGELFNKIVERGQYKETDASKIVAQICSAVAYLHGEGIAHRDLKPENLLCSGDDEDQIKIADFGLSKIFADGEGLETSCGTPDYVAPEILKCQPYDHAVDLWSIGVIAYILLCGYPPFYGRSQNDLFGKIMNCDYDFPAQDWDYISETAKDFVQKLLVKEPEKRLTAVQCLEHPWLKSSVGQSERDLFKNGNFMGSIKEYNVNRKKIPVF